MTKSEKSGPGFLSDTKMIQSMGTLRTQNIGREKNVYDGDTYRGG